MQIKEEFWNYTNLRAKIILCLKKHRENTCMPSLFFDIIYFQAYSCSALSVMCSPSVEAKTSSKSVMPALTNKLYQLTNFLISAG